MQHANCASDTLELTSFQACCTERGQERIGDCNHFSDELRMRESHAGRQIVVNCTSHVLDAYARLLVVSQS